MLTPFPLFNDNILEMVFRTLTVNHLIDPGKPWTPAHAWKFDSHDMATNYKEVAF